MTTGRKSYDVVIIGGGITGCSSARELASDHDVLLLEKDRIAGDASGKASGLVTFSAQRSTYPDFVEYSLSFFHEYDGTDHFEFYERNGVEPTPPEKEREARERAAGAEEHGLDLTYRTTDEIAERYPGVFDLSEYVGALEYGDTGWVDPYTCTMSYKEDAEDSGAEVETDTPVEEVKTRDGAVVGVETNDGEVIEAEHVVCAAGWWSRRLLADIVEIPVRPMRYQAVDVEPDEELGDTYPIGMDPVTDLYWRAQPNGDLHVGGGEYLVEDPGSVRRSVDEEFRMKVATELPGRLKGMEHAEITSEDTCPTGDAATPDSLPILDAPEEAPEGLVVATGFHGYGIMSSPSAGRAVRSLVTGEPCPFSLDPVGLDRFEDRSTDFGLVSLADKRAKFN